MTPRRKVHPFTALEYLSRFSFLFILPLLGQVGLLLQRREMPPFTLWRNVLLFFLLILLCLLKYRMISYRAAENAFLYRSGILRKKALSIPYFRIHSITIKESFFASIFGAVKLRLDTPSGRKNKADLSLTLSKHGLAKTLRSILPINKSERVYLAATWRIVLMAASWSDSATGLLITAPFIHKLGSVLGREISEKLYSTVNLSLKAVALGIPPVAAVIAYVLVAGWGISLLVQFFRYANFSVWQAEENILIRHGLVFPTKTIIARENINAVLIKQTLLMHILKLYSASINAIGTGKEKGDRSMLVAAASYDELKRLVEKILGISLALQKQFRPKPKAIVSFLWFPGALFVLDIFLLCRLSSKQHPILVFPFAFGAAFLLWWLMLRIAAYRTSGLSFAEDQLLLGGFRRLSLVSSSVPAKKIQLVRVIQNPLQRYSGHCHVKIYILSDKKEYFTVRHLMRCEVEDLFAQVECANRALEE